MAFLDNQLTNANVPDSVISIGAAAFENNQLNNVIIGNSVVRIGQSAFMFNQLTSVVIPDGVVCIAAEAFFGNQLASVIIGNDIVFMPGIFTDDKTGGFGSAFVGFYKAQGRMAGTYTYSNGQWSFRPR